MKISPILLIVAGFVLGLIVARRFADAPSPTTQPLVVTQSVEIIYDTITMHDIRPTEVVLLEPHDTTSAMPPLNLYTFKDTLSERWSAKIVGRDVQLQSLTINDRIEHHHITSHYPPRWELMAQGSINNLAPWVGIVATHNRGRMHFSTHIGYNPLSASMIYGVTVGVRLWSRY